MMRAFFPFRFVSSHALSEALEVAHQQIEVGEHHIALSTRVTEAGDLIVDLELGDPRLAKRLITEEELRRANEQSRAKAGFARAKKRRLRR